MPFYHLIFCCPLLPLPLIFPSIRVFSNVSSNIGGFFLSLQVLILTWSHAFLSISWSFTRIKYMRFSKALNPPDGEIKKRHVLRWAISAAAWKPESQWNSGHWLSSAGEQSKGRRLIHSETLKSLGFGGSSYVRRRGEELGLKNRATYLDLHMGHFLNFTHTLLL